MRLVLDTNILVDAAMSREPHVASADKLFALGGLGEFELWMGSSQVTDLLYMITDGGKPSLAEEARREMVLLRKRVHVYATNEADYDAVAASTWTDLEDAFVYQTAVAVKADAIITRDKTGFVKSPLRVFDYEGLFDYLESEGGVAYDVIDML